MSETPAHFVAVCPSCLSSLRIRSVYDGAQVRCKHCDHKFRVFSPDRIEAAEGDGRDEHDEYMVVSCPSCETALEMPQEFAGHRVRCNHCEAMFLVEHVVKTPASWTSAPDQDDPVHHPRGILTPDDAPGGAGRAGPRPGTSEVAEELASLRSGHERLEAELAARDGELSRLRSQNDEAEARLGRAVEESTSLRRRIDELEAECGRLGGLLRDHEAVANEREGLAEARGRLERELAEARLLVDEQAVRAQRAEEGLEAARAELERAGVQLRDLDAEHATLRGDRDRLEGLAGGLEEELRAARDEAARVAGELGSHREALAAARAESGRLSADASGLQAELELARRTMADQGAEIAAREREIAAREREIAERERAAREEREQLGGEVDRVRASLAAIERAHESELTSALDEARSRHAHDLSSAIAELRARFADELEGALNEARGRHGDDLARLQSRLDESAQAAARLEADLRDVARARSISEAELAAAREEIAALRKQLGDTQTATRTMSSMLEGMGIRLH
ncbi:Chromosome partition protein Smc [Aquisphaera giovannonii]|uniref:Chromosome partition protein Smc n=1 Tax=Aquisphaera giovannonii TaxID=406548 RepID=A0A5B9VVZ0_9BACT|nr:hypothetical protein [Aquisphaera giovannonii]QEH32031.1 Chromosome partition protein Smc [Aquisphaera giovannonii]